MSVSEIHAPDRAGRVLRRARELVDPVLRDAVALLPGSLATAAGYQFGWFDEHGIPVQGKAGKGVRPALTVLCAEAAGGTGEAAARAAAAVELVHDFSLVHDDIMDGDDTRRHRPTVWAAYGVPAAVLAGDALLALAVGVLPRSPDGEATRRLAQALLALVQGQARDVEFEQRDHVDVAEYLAMAEGKTAALIECACALGALSADADPPTVRLLSRFGHHLGLAFQLVDDILGIWGAPGVTGKPALSDLRARKKTYPVVLALADRNGEFARLYGQPLTGAGLDEALRCLDRLDLRRRTEEEARRQVRLALACLTEAHLVPRAAADLAALAHRLVSREH